MEKVVFGFWSRLKEVLHQNHYTMNRLSVELGYSEKTYAVKKTTNVLPTTNDIVRICSMFNVSADWLLFGSSIPPDVLNLSQSILELPPEMRSTVNTLITSLHKVKNDIENRTTDIP